MIESVNIQLGGRNLTMETGRYARQAAEVRPGPLCRYGRAGRGGGGKGGEAGPGFLPAHGRLPGKDVRRRPHPAASSARAGPRKECSGLPTAPAIRSSRMGSPPKCRCTSTCCPMTRRTIRTCWGFWPGALALNLSTFHSPARWPRCGLENATESSSSTPPSATRSSARSTWSWRGRGFDPHGGRRRTPELGSEVLEALRFAHESIGAICRAQKPLIARAGRAKRPLVLSTVPENIRQEVGVALRGEASRRQHHSRQARARRGHCRVHAEALLAFAESHPRRPR